MAERIRRWQVGIFRESTEHVAPLPAGAETRAGPTEPAPLAADLENPGPPAASGRPTPLQLAGIVLAIIGIVLTIYFGLRVAAPASPAPALPSAAPVYIEALPADRAPAGDRHVPPSAT